METRKSTKSWDQLGVQKFPKVTQSRKKVHRVGKLVLPSLVAWRACTKIRDAPAEKRHESKVQRSSTRTEMLFLWCFSAPYWERISAASGAHCTLLSHIMLLNVWNWSLLRSEGKVQNWVRRRSYYLNLCEAHGLNTWGQLPHLMKNDRKFSIMRRTSCSSLSRVLSIGSSCSTSPTSPTSLSQDYEKYYVSSNNTKWEYEWKQAQGDLLQTQSQDDEQARGNPLQPELPWGKVYQEKNSHSLPENTEIAKCRRARTTWTLCKRRKGEATPRAAKFRRIGNSRAQSLNWDLWIGKQSPIRYRGTKFGSWKIRDETKLLGAD